MDSRDVAEGRPPVYAVVLSGCRATFINDFRRRSHHLQDLLESLGVPSRPAAVNKVLILGHLSTLLIIGAGILWTPQPTALRTLGIPLSVPDAVAIVTIGLAIALLAARRRYGRAHRSWNTVSTPLEVGMRAGVVVMDLGLASMLILQNLRWHESENLLAAAALLVSSFQVVAPFRGVLIQMLIVLIITLSASSLTVHFTKAFWLDDGTLGSALGQKLLLAMAGTVLIGVSTPALYKATAHPRALHSRGLLTDLGIKASSIFLTSSLALLIMEMTPWPWTAPSIALIIFFLGLVLYRSSLARIATPEALGFAIFLIRLRPSWVRPIVLRSLVTTIALITPLTFVLCIFLLFAQYGHMAVLLASLVPLEIGMDALIVQRRTAVMPASHISRLPQKSKTGLGAALCAGLAVVLSGILGAVALQATQSPWLSLASGGLILVAVLLTSLVLNDASAWLRELSATETENA